MQQSVAVPLVDARKNIVDLKRAAAKEALIIPNPFYTGSNYWRSGFQPKAEHHLRSRGSSLTRNGRRLYTRPLGRPVEIAHRATSRGREVLVQGYLGVLEQVNCCWIPMR
jgi:hypothetical protein